MDPITILGAVAACAQLATLITRVTSNLATLKAQWSEGAQSLQLLIARLTSIRAALAQISDWADVNASNESQGQRNM
jgi:capsule polysaccharide export protein KpsE/RkpR